MTTSKQLLVNFTSTSGSLNFGMIIIQHLSNLVLNMLVDSAYTTLLYYAVLRHRALIYGPPSAVDKYVSSVGTLLHVHTTDY